MGERPPKQPTLEERRLALDPARRRRAEAAGLSEDASWSEIEELEMRLRNEGNEQRNKRLQEMAKEVIDGTKTEEDYAREAETLPRPNEIFMAGRDEMRRGLAAEFGLSENAGWNDISSAKFKKQTREQALSLGLPEDASYTDIYFHEQDLKRKQRAHELGLKEDTPWEVMRRMDPEWEARRFKWIAEFGLSDNATWEQITPLIIEKTRVEMAKRFGLSKDASWSEISEAQDEWESKG